MPRVLQAFPRPEYGEVRRSALPTTGAVICEEFTAPSRSMSARAIRSQSSGHCHNFGSSRLSVLSMRQGDSSPLSDEQREFLIAASRVEDQIGCGVLYADKLVHLTTPCLDEARVLLGMPITQPPTQRAEVGAGEAGFVGCVAEGPSSYFVICEDGKFLHIAFHCVEGRWEAESVRPIPESHLGFEPRGRLRMACSSTRDSLRLVVANMDLLNVYEFPRNWDTAPGTIRKRVHSLEKTILDVTAPPGGEKAYVLVDGGAIFRVKLGVCYERQPPEKLLDDPVCTTLASGNGFIVVGGKSGEVSYTTPGHNDLNKLTQVSTKVARIFAAPRGKGFLWVSEGKVYSIADNVTYLVCHLEDGESITTATYSPSALQAFVGTNMGRVLVLDMENLGGSGCNICTELCPSASRPRVVSVAIYTSYHCYRNQESKNRRLHSIMDRIPQKEYGIEDISNPNLCEDFLTAQPQPRPRSESRASTHTLSEGAIRSNSMQRSNSTNDINSWISGISKPQHATKKRSYSELSLEIDLESEEPPSKMKKTEEQAALEPVRRTSSPPEASAEGALPSATYIPHAPSQHPTPIDAPRPSTQLPASHIPHISQQQNPPSLVLEPTARVYRIRKSADSLHTAIRMCEHQPFPAPLTLTHYPSQPSPVGRFSFGPDAASTPVNFGRPSNTPSAISIDLAAPNPFSSPPFSPKARPKSPTPPTPIPLERLSSNLFTPTCLASSATQTDSSWEDETIARANDRLLNSLQAWIDSQRAAM